MKAAAMESADFSAVIFLYADFNKEGKNINDCNN